MEYLFSYGTLQNPMVQEKLFHRKINLHNAILVNHALYSCSDGFFTTAYKEGSSVKGSILELLEKELLVADLWEIVPDLYQRSIKVLNVLGQTITAWIYERSEEDQVYIEQSIANNCSLSNQELETELNTFYEEYSSQIENILLKRY